MANKTYRGAKRYNDNLDRIWENAKRLQQMQKDNRLELLYISPILTAREIQESTKVNDND